MKYNNFEAALEHAGRIHGGYVVSRGNPLTHYVATDIESRAADHGDYCWQCFEPVNRAATLCNCGANLFPIEDYTLFVPSPYKQ